MRKLTMGRIFLLREFSTFFELSCLAGFIVDRVNYRLCTSQHTKHHTDGLQKLSIYMQFKIDTTQSY